MGDHILRRGQPTRPPQPKPTDRRSTAEIPEQQLHELIHDPTHDDLEAELELVEAFPEVLPDSTPINLSSPPSQRLANTMPRDAHAAMPAQPVPAVPPSAERTEVLPIPTPRAQAPARPARPARVIPAASSAAPLLDGEALPSLLPPDPEPRLLTEIRTLPSAAAVTEAPLTAEPPSRPVLRSTGRARLILPLVLLVLALGAAALWLR